MKNGRSVIVHVRARIPATLWTRVMPLCRHSVEAKRLTRRQFLAFWRKECARCGRPYSREKYGAEFEALYIKQNPKK